MDFNTIQSLQEAYQEVFQLMELTGGKGHPGYKAGSRDLGPMQSGHPADTFKRTMKGGTMSMRHGDHLGDLDDKDDDEGDLEAGLKDTARKKRENVRKPLRDKVRTARRRMTKEDYELVMELTGGKGHPGYKAGSRDLGPMQDGHPADTVKRRIKGGTMSQRHGYHLGDIDDKDDDDGDEYESIVKQQSRDKRETVRKPLRDKVRAARKRMTKEDYELDIYDIILSHLLAEGYADTNKAALAIMVNMSEEWKQSILNEDPVQDYRDMQRAKRNTPLSRNDSGLTDYGAGGGAAAEAKGIPRADVIKQGVINRANLEKKSQAVNPGPNFGR